VLNPAAPLPGTLSPFDLRFRVSPLVTSTTPIDPDMGTAEDGPV
jgi:hypothetical protein